MSRFNYLWIVYALMLFVTVVSANALVFSSSYDLITGTVNSGNLSSTYALDNDYFIIREVSEGLSISFTLNSIDENNLIINGRYRGGSNHYILVKVFNFNTSSYEFKAIIPSSSNFYLFNIPLSNNNVDVNGDVVLLLEHNDVSGVLSHYLDVDYVALTHVNSEEFVVSPLFFIDLTDTFTVVFIIFLIIMSVFIGLIYSTIIGGSGVSLVGLFLLFNSFNPLISGLIIILGVGLVFMDTPPLK